MVVREFVTKLGFKTDKKSLKNYENVTRKALSFTKKAAIGVGIALLGIGAAAIKSAGDMETLRISFEVMLGSAQKSVDMIKSLREFQVNTPFELDTIGKASETLLQFGVAGKDILPTIKMLGDVAGSNSEKFQSLALVFGQIQSTGRLMGQDLLQLINQGFNPLQVISQKTGQSVAFLKDEMAKGRISADQVTQSFKIATSQGGLFFENLKKQSNSFAGAMGSLKAALKDVLILIGEALLPTIKSFLSIMTKLARGPLQELAIGLSKVLIPIFEVLLKEIFPILVKAIVPLLNIVGKVLGMVLKAIVPIFKLLEPIVLLVETLAPVLELVANLLVELITPLVPLLNELLLAIIPIVTLVVKVLTRLPLDKIIRQLANVLFLVIKPLTILLQLFNSIIESPFFLKFASMVGETMDKVVKFFGDMRDKVKEIFEGVFDSVFEKFRKLFELANKLSRGAIKIPSFFDKAEEAGKSSAAGSVLGKGDLNAPIKSEINVNVNGSATSETANEIGKAVANAAQSAFTIELRKILVEAST